MSTEELIKSLTKRIEDLEKAINPEVGTMSVQTDPPPTPGHDYPANDNGGRNPQTGKVTGP